MGRLLNNARNKTKRRNQVAAKKADPDSSLRPDQRLKKQRDAAAEKIRLAEMNRPTSFGPIGVLPDKKAKDPSKNQRSSYCEKCLRKYKLKPGPSATNCVDCGALLIRVKSRTEMNRIVRRLKKERRQLRLTTPKKRSYDVYLKSKLWRRIRKRILERDENLCRECGVKAEHVHHLSYGPLVMLGMDDSKLISLCIPCHDSRHPDKPSMLKAK